MTLPSPEQLIKGRVYRLKSRRLGYGVWDGKAAFVGVRTKFGFKFLDDENHWNIECGTVKGAEDTGIDMPPEINIGSKELLEWLQEKVSDFESGADALKTSGRPGEDNDYSH